MDERDIFIEAIQVADADDRLALIRDRCGANSDLKQKVEALLDAHARAVSFLETPPSELAPGPTVDRAPAERPGAQIGPYKLLQQIGEGGMGMVYMAEQTEPLRRKVALKIIKPGMDTRQVIARFEAERQALSLMDHPNIAKVLDAGAVGMKDEVGRMKDEREGQSPSSFSPHPSSFGEASRPYFVMELMKGQPITEYCDQRRLTPRQRLELFLPVCQAIQHAHQKGIIHRDIKPSNVLVAEYDGRPVAKVIDFGVAKAISQPLTEKTMFTCFGQIVGTLEYMSPEQASVNQLDIDTRSDIYSLGVLLYELLTGATPFDKQRLRSAAWDEMLRIIREEDPPKPSTRLSESSRHAPHADGTPSAPTTLASIAAVRNIEPAKLTRLVRGELDWIVMKALEKDRGRRYETAIALASDLQRYLNDEPVQACPPSAGYRLQKFARRHRTTILTTTLVAAALLVAVAAATGGVGWALRDRQAVRQQVEQDRLARKAALDQEVTQAIQDVELWYERGNLSELRSALKRAEQLIASAGGLIGDELRQQAVEWSHEYAILERLDQLEPGDIREESPQADAAYAGVFRELGINIDELPVEESGRRIRAHRSWRRITEALDRWAAVRQNLMMTRRSVEEKSAASQAKIRVLQVARAADPDELRSRARLIVEKWDAAAARKLADSPQVHQLPASLVRHLAMVIYWGRGDGTDQQFVDRRYASELLESAVLKRPSDWELNYSCGTYYMFLDPPQWRMATRYFSAAAALSPEKAGVIYYLGVSLTNDGQLQPASVCFRKAVELNPKHVNAHIRRGITLLRQGQRNEARDCFRRALELEPDSANAHINLGLAWAQAGNVGEAIACFKKARELSPELAAAHHNLGRALYDQRQWEEAIACYRKAIELNPNDAKAYVDLGVALTHKTSWSETIACFRKAIELDPKYAQAYTNLGTTLLNHGKLNESIECYRKALELNPGFAGTYAGLGKALTRQGRLEEAIACCNRSLELDPREVSAYVNLAAALTEKRQLDEAIVCCQKALELDPQSANAHNQMGNALTIQGRVDEALVWRKKSVVLLPNDPKVHFNLAFDLSKNKQLDEAIVEYREALRLDPNLVVARDNLRKIEHITESLKRLPSVVQGDDEPKDAAERLVFAQLCQQYRSQYRAAARLYTDAFNAAPNLAVILEQGHRYNAACAAALAGCGQGEDAQQSDDRERDRLRGQALEWLHADLTSWDGLLEASPVRTSRALTETLRHWKQDADLSGVRDQEKLDDLPEAERLRWRELWTAVDELLEKSTEKQPPASTLMQM